MGTMTAFTEINVIIAVSLLIIQLTFAHPAKTNARPVHEVINEQARMDEKIRLTTGASSLPYGNPLAGNSQKNARLHAQNQQAMFNAERVRQHRAQLQRWNKTPLPVDSYMKAYHESQESHQMAVEQQQSNIREKKTPSTPQKTKSRQTNRQETLKRGVSVLPDVIKLTKADAMIKDKSRNHRSHGSVDYRQYLEPKMYRNVFISPAPTYDQGVTIKPNGNIGLASHKPVPEESQLYTEAIPSKTRYVYPKQHSQIQNYESAKDILTLNALLKKAPQVQVSELNALINAEKTEEKDVLDTPIDLFFYTKDPPIQNLASHYDQPFAQIPPTYASAYMPHLKDHTPITEEVDDIENPKDPRIKPHAANFIAPSPIPDINPTTKSINHYNAEVASQFIAGHKPNEVNQYYEDEIQYKPYVPAVYFKNHQVDDDDHSERYLHHNLHQQGVQHLHEDGTGVSAYGDESLHYAANYEFGYRVRDYKSGNNFGHQEAKRGSKTNGQYHVLLPDGRMQKVQYSAGPEGFHADITYDHLK